MEAVELSREEVAQKYPEVPRLDPRDVSETIREALFH